MCVREENVVPWKSKKPRPDSHQNLSVARFSFTHTLQKISTLSPSPLLHYEDFKCVEGSIQICVCEKKMWSPGNPRSRHPILTKICQPLAVRTYNHSRKYQLLPPLPSCTTRTPITGEIGWSLDIRYSEV